jgi:DNA-binding response OmpR family regulator
VDLVREQQPDEPASQTLVLVVENEPVIADLICEVLEDHGYRCITAKDANVALRLLETARPALITLDLGLPGVSGRALLELIRARETTCDTPVIVISAARIIDRQVRAASQAVLTKPFELEQLVATVRQALA